MTDQKSLDYSNAIEIASAMSYLLDLVVQAPVSWLSGSERQAPYFTFQCESSEDAERLRQRFASRKLLYSNRNMDVYANELRVWLDRTEVKEFMRKLHATLAAERVDISQNFSEAAGLVVSQVVEQIRPERPIPALFYDDYFGTVVPPDIMSEHHSIRRVIVVNRYTKESGRVFVNKLRPSDKFDVCVGETAYAVGIKSGSVYDMIMSGDVSSLRPSIYFNRATEKLHVLTNKQVELIKAHPEWIQRVKPPQYQL